MALTLALTLTNPRPAHAARSVPSAQVPFATRVTIVSGRPVRVGPPNPNPTDAELMALLAAYDAELQTIFRDHGPTSLPADIAANGLLVRWRGAGGEAVGAGAAVAKETKPRASAVRSLQ